MSLENMNSVLRYMVPPGSVALWWLGQNGFLLKTPGGKVIAVDAYLSNSCQKIGEAAGLDLSRQIPIFIEPEELEVDYFLCTHSHHDHADPETIARTPAERVSHFIAPGLTCETYHRCGVPKERIRQAYPGSILDLAEVKIHGTFALPTDGSDLNHVGYVLALEQGPSIYITGDTDFHEHLGHVSRLEPDIMIVCINGGFNNLSHFEAAEVASLIKPKVAIPSHYDMFRDNLMDPRQFRANLKYKAPEVKFQQVNHMEPFVFEKASTGNCELS